MNEKMSFQVTVSLKTLVTHRTYWSQCIFNKALIFECFQLFNAKFFDYNFRLNESKCCQIVHKLNIMNGDKILEQMFII